MQLLFKSHTLLVPSLRSVFSFLIFSYELKKHLWITQLLNDNTQHADKHVFSPWRGLGDPRVFACWKNCLGYFPGFPKEKSLVFLCWCCWEWMESRLQRLCLSCLSKALIFLRNKQAFKLGTPGMCLSSSTSVSVCQNADPEKIDLAWIVNTHPCLCNDLPFKIWTPTMLSLNLYNFLTPNMKAKSNVMWLYGSTHKESIVKTETDVILLYLNEAQHCVAL